MAAQKSHLYTGCLYTKTQEYNKLGRLLIFRRRIKEAGLHLQQLGDWVLIL